MNIFDGFVEIDLPRRRKKRKYEDVHSESRLHNERKDCSVIAVVLTTGLPYRVVHEMFAFCGRKPRKGTPWDITERVMKELGFTLEPIEVESRTIRTLVRELRVTLPEGRCIIRVRKHLASYVDGSIEDWSAGTCKRIKDCFLVEPI